MNQLHPRRSALYMPGSNARAMEKGRGLQADAIILDLEDSVAPSAKIVARTLACAAVKAGGFDSREVIIRVNGKETPWGEEDLAAAMAAGPDAILLPKVSTPQQIAAVAAATGGRIPLWGMIETCRAILALDALGAASRQHGLCTWVMGTNDLAKEMRCANPPGRAPLLPALGLAVVAARCYGLCILDGVWNNIADLAGLEQECAQGRDLGFDGKSLVHPSHLAITNAAYSPAAEAVVWARTVVAAFEAPENAGAGVIQVQGRMVETLHLEQARRLIAMADEIAQGITSLGTA